MYKESQDLLLYLRRFESYANAIGAAPEDRANIYLLISLLDDPTLNRIERHLEPVKKLQ